MKKIWKFVGVNVLAGVLVSQTFASNIHLNGIVTGGGADGSAAVEGVRIFLKQMNLTTKTDAQGFYSLDSVMPAPEIEEPKDSVPQRISTWNVNYSPVTIHPKFSFDGHHLQVAVPSSNGISRVFDAHGRMLGVRYNSTDAKSVLRKVALELKDEFSDTLVFEKEGYITKNVALSKSEATINVSLVVAEMPMDSAEKKDTVPTSSLAPEYACTPDGYAMVDGITTGGAGGDTVVVSTYADFKAAVQATEAKVVVVKGTVKTTDGDGYGLKIASNKTIMGKDSSATIYGGIAISGVSNVIVYNLNLNGTYPNPGPSDAIAVNKSNHVFISHVNIWNAEDGNLDITNQSNYVTVSYVKFWYTDKNHPHRLNALIGSGASDHPEDFGKLKVTYHHNWFGTLLNERMPRVMYGNVHIYNNYYTATDNLYGVGVGSYGSALIENNYFYKTKNPIIFMYNVYAYINTQNNVYDGTTLTYSGTVKAGSTNVGANDGGKMYGERYITTDPYTLMEDPVKMISVPYKYSMEETKDVPNSVKKAAGPHTIY